MKTTPGTHTLPFREARFPRGGLRVASGTKSGTRAIQIGSTTSDTTSDYVHYDRQLTLSGIDLPLSRVGIGGNKRRILEMLGMQTIDQLTIRRFIGGPMLTACYVLIAPGRESILIDAPRDAWRSAAQAADDLDAPVRRLIVTHGHWDHITDASKIAATGVPVLGHPADLELGRNPMGQRSDVPFVIEPIEYDRHLGEGDRIDLAGHEIQVLHTPGHSPGSISLWLPEIDALFSGDTVLKGGAGYLERPESDAWALASSVQRIASLPESTTLYPGHGPPTTLQNERWLIEATDRDELVELWQSGKARWTPRS